MRCEQALAPRLDVRDLPLPNTASEPGFVLFLLPNIQHNLAEQPQVFLPRSQCSEEVQKLILHSHRETDTASITANTVRPTPGASEAFPGFVERRRP